MSHHEKRRLNVIKRLIFSGVMVLLFVCYLEAILHLLCVVSERVDHLLLEELPSLYEPVQDEKIGSRPNAEHPEHDARGFRNQFVPQSAMVVAMGDSQTYGAGVEPHEAWPHQLAELADLQVYNLAYGGFGPVHSLVLLGEALSLKPRVIVEAFYAGNDLFDSYHLVYDLDKASELKSGDVSILHAIRERSERDLLDERVTELFQGPQRRWLHQIISAHSKIWAVARAFDRQLRENSENYLWRHWKKKSRDSQGHFQALETDQFRTILTPRYRLAALDFKDVRIVEGHRLSLEAIGRIHQRCREAGVQFVVLLIPTKELVFKELADSSGAISKDLISLTQNEIIMWERSRAYFNANEIDFVDALSILRECLKDGLQPYNITPDGHPNPKGHEMIAKLIEMVLKDKNLI